MTPADANARSKQSDLPNRYRLPGIEREGIAQLSLLETALWPLEGGRLPDNAFSTRYSYSTKDGRKNADVTVRAGAGLQTIDELILWGLLGATLCRQDPQPVLLATPYWMLRHLGMATGGSQYTELRESLLRLALTSYQNTAFYNPESQEHEYAAFQFLTVFLPTVGGVGERVDTERSWRIEWNPAFFRFCQATGGNLLFDLDVYRQLTPATRRLFLKLKDRFWREKRVFMSLDDLTINGLGFSAARARRLRKFDLTNCIRELLAHDVVSLGRGQTDPKELFLKRGKGSYVVLFHEGAYFRRPPSERTIMQKNAIMEDPLYEPLRKIGVDGPGIFRLLMSPHRSLVQRWVRITEAAMHEHPRGFPGFRVSPAAFLMDGVEHQRMPPDWMYAHEKRQQQLQEQSQRIAAADDPGLRARYEHERTAAIETYLSSPEGQQHYDRSYAALLPLHKLTDPHRCEAAAAAAARERVERLHFRFPEFELWRNAHRKGSEQAVS